MTQDKYKVRFRIPEALHKRMLDDLRRPHPHAYERIGFLYTQSKIISDNIVLIVATDYTPVDDNHYIEDDEVGAKINSLAIRSAMQHSFEKKAGCFHVHLHDHSGKPYPSPTDKNSLPDVVESLANIASSQANGILILSKNSFYASVKVNKTHSYVIPEIITKVGNPMLFAFSDEHKFHKKRYSRQSFLGESAQSIFENLRIGIIGYGGGGSHIGQQLAHLGVKNIVIFDDDKIEETNLNRLIGAWFSDVKKAALKTSIAKRIITRINPNAQVICINSRWQHQPELLQSCDVVFGCVDSYSERQQAEAECRRYLIPYIDIGMDVYQLEVGYSMSGQVILSLPGCSCMRCYQFLTEDKLAQEAAKYGDVGGRPQVVWPNGVLASTAVGVFINLVTNWSKSNETASYLAYDGNTGFVNQHIRTKFTNEVCPHYPLDQIGQPRFLKL